MQLEDAPDLDTQAGQDNLIANTTPKAKDELPWIMEDATVRAMQDTLLVILVLILLTLLISTFLPDLRIGQEDRQRIRQSQTVSVES